MDPAEPGARPSVTSGSAKLQPDRPAAADRARNLMHGIFTGEIQALEGAGRTTFDFDDDEAPFALKLDMARQCWDESRHVEISVKLGDWMGTEIGEYSEATFLYEAACADDPILRLCGVNRALEGLAIDVFNTMKEFGDIVGRPGARVLRGLDARRRGDPREDGLRLAAPPHRERPGAARAGARVPAHASTSSSAWAASAARATRTRSSSPASCARWPASPTDEIDEISEIAAQAQADAQAMAGGAAPA